MEVPLAVLAATFTTAIVFFPSRFSLWRKQISFYCSCPGRGAFHLRFLYLGHDSRAAVLRQVSFDVARSVLT